MKLDGIHHITAITGDAPGNVDFYTRVLGLRLVKKTVNFDNHHVYHFYYGDERADLWLMILQRGISDADHDFIGNKTALLGMTRMGKSNTAKTIIARTFIV